MSGHELKVGDGVTVLGWTDASAATVTAVSRSGKMVTTRRDHAKLLNGSGSGEPNALRFSPGGFCGHTSGTQRWELTPNPEGTEERWSLRELRDRRGETFYRWVLVGSRSRGGARMQPGRSHYYDFNF